MGEEDQTKCLHHASEQLVPKLREADRLAAEGTSMVEVCKHQEVTEQTYCRWRNQHSGMETDDAERS